MQIISEPGCQVFKLVALFPVGRSMEPKRGLVQSAAAMMKKETQLKSNKQLHQLLDRYSIQIEVYSTPTHLTAQLHCHKKFIEQAIPIFFEVLFCAKFSSKQWGLVRQQIVDSIEQQLRQTDFVADKLLSEHLFGDDHPYGYYSQPLDYRNIQLADIEDFYSTYIQCQKPELFLAGDGVLEAKQRVLEEMHQFSFSSVKRKKVQCFDRIPRLIEKKLEEGSSQASVRLGKLFPRKSFQDFQQLELMTMHLGGYYMSELMNLLRVQMGLTYGVYAHLSHFPNISVLYIGFETDDKNVAVSLEAISHLFQRFQKMKHIEISASAREYYSQWSKNAEKSLQEIMYNVRMFKLGYDYNEYSSWTQSLGKGSKMQRIALEPSVFDFSTYSKSVVY